MSNIEIQSNSLGLDFELDTPDTNNITVICSENEDKKSFNVSKELLQYSKYFQSIFMLDRECKEISISMSPFIFENVLYFLEIFKSNPIFFINENNEIPENETQSYVFSPLDKRYYVDNLKGKYSKFQSMKKSECFRTMQCGVYLDIDPLTQLMGAELAYRIASLTDEQYDDIKQNYTEITDWLVVDD